MAKEDHIIKLEDPKFNYEKGDLIIKLPNEGGGKGANK